MHLVKEGFVENGVDLNSAYVIDKLIKENKLKF